MPHDPSRRAPTVTNIAAIRGCGAWAAHVAWWMSSLPIRSAGVDRPHRERTWCRRGTSRHRVAERRASLVPLVRQGDGGARDIRHRTGPHVEVDELRQGAGSRTPGSSPCCRPRAPVGDCRDPRSRHARCLRSLLARSAAARCRRSWSSPRRSHRGAPATVPSRDDVDRGHHTREQRHHGDAHHQRRSGRRRAPRVAHRVVAGRAHRGRPARRRSGCAEERSHAARQRPVRAATSPTNDDQRAQARAAPSAESGIVDAVATPTPLTAASETTGDGRQAPGVDFVLAQRRDAERRCRPAGPGPARRRPSRRRRPRRRARTTSGVNVRPPAGSAEPEGIEQRLEAGGEQRARARDR